MRMTVERLTTPEAEAFSLSDVKAHLRVSHDDEDGTITGCGRVAVREVEEYGGLALLTQTIRVSLSPAMLDGASVITLPVGPVLAEAEVIVQIDGEAVDGFTVSRGNRAAVTLAGAPAGERLVITYEAGFGSDASAVPADLRHAILDQVAALFDGRGHVDAKSLALSCHFARIVARYRRVRV